MASVTRNRNLRGQVEVETSKACLKVLEPQVDMSTFRNATRHLFPVTSNPVGTFYCPHPVRSQLTWKLGKPAIETPLSRTYRAGQGKGEHTSQSAHGPHWRGDPENVSLYSFWVVCLKLRGDV